MKKAMLALAVFLLLATAPPSDAGPQGCTGYPELQAFAFESITINSTAVGFTAATYAPPGLRPADMALVTMETANDLRWRDDGINPTAAVGQLEPAGSKLLVCGAISVSRIRFIRTVSSPNISVTYYRAVQ